MYICIGLNHCEHSRYYSCCELRVATFFCAPFAEGRPRGRSEERPS